MLWRLYKAPKLLWQKRGRWWEQWLEIIARKWKRRRKSSTSWSRMVIDNTVELVLWSLNGGMFLNGLENTGIWTSSQFLIEIASAQVKVVCDSPKKCVFNRRGRATTQKVAAVEEALQQPKAQSSQTQEGTETFIFLPAKEEFRFNFLWFFSPFNTVTVLNSVLTLYICSQHKCGDDDIGHQQ